jgi:hypothetical protein
MRWANSIKFLGPLAAAIIWTGFVTRRFSPEPAWADASGYFNSASLISQGKLTAKLRASEALKWYYPYDLEPLGFHFDSSRSVLVPTYFVGLPILLACAHCLGGWDFASYVVILGSAMLLLVCSYLILRALEIERRLAMAAVVGLAWCPIFVFSSSQTYSDVVAGAGCALAGLCALKSSKANLIYALSAGMSLGFMLLVRSTNVLLLPSLLIMTSSWKNRVAIGVGCLPFVATLMGYQHLVYGGAMRSGYGAIFKIFDWRYVPSALAHYTTMLPKLLPIAVLSPIGVFCASARWPRRVRLGLVAWVASFGAFYAFYYFTGREWTSLRFIEPTFPALLALACIAIEAIAARVASASSDIRVLPAASAILLVVSGCLALFSHFADPRLHDRGFVAARVWMRQNLPPDSLVVCKMFSGSVYFATPNPTLRWDETSKENIGKYLRDMWNAGKSVYSVLDASELADPDVRRKIAGRWEKLADFQTATVWRIEAPTEKSAGN